MYLKDNYSTIKDRKTLCNSALCLHDKVYINVDHFKLMLHSST
jgi:hypothetical protein